jgi:hypothetical protein
MGALHSCASSGLFGREAESLSSVRSQILLAGAITAAVVAAEDLIAIRTDALADRATMSGRSMIANQIPGRAPRPARRV